MKVVKALLSLIALTDAKAIQSMQICTVYDTCASLNGCCVAVAETKGGNAASSTQGLCVPDGTKVGT